MDTLNAAVFVVAVCFGLAQHMFEDDHAPLSEGLPRWWTNGVLFAADTAIVSLFAAAIAWLTWVDSTTSTTHGPMGSLPVLAQMGVLLIGHGFVQYWLHRAGHRVPLLWTWHRIHHSDTRLDATTGLRHHPIESVLEYIAFLSLTVALAPTAAGVLGYFILNIAFAMFTHSPPAWLPARLDRALASMIMTPRLHQLHHSRWRKETDTNYGNILVVWDRLFGTYLAAPDSVRPGFALGLDEFPQKTAQDPFLQMASPFIPIDDRDELSG
jgi:sterol desaturase/sphingolipid hydroxylase (fatty acid hydroxylase superfamily)